MSPVSDAVGAVGSVVNGLINRHSQKETNKRNAEMNAANNRFNAEQAKLERDWSSSEAAKSRDFTTSERLAQQEWQEKMADPRLQVNKWLDAGLSAANFDGDVSANGVPSGASSSAPSGAAASAASPIAMQSPQFNFDPLALAQANLMNAQASSIKHEDERKQDLHPIELKIANNTLKLGEFDLNTMKPAEAARVQQETKNLQKEIDVLSSQISVNEELASLYNKQGELVQKDVDSYADRLAKNFAEQDSRIRLNNSQAKLCVAKMAEAYASAKNQTAQAGYYNEAAKTQQSLQGLYGSQKEGQDTLNLLNGLEYEWRDDNRKDYKRYKIQIEQNNVTESNLRIMELRGDAAVGEYISDHDALISLAAFTKSLNGAMHGSSNMGAAAILRTMPKPLP